MLIGFKQPFNGNFECKIHDIYVFSMFKALDSVPIPLPNKQILCKYTCIYLYVCMYT